MTHNNSSVSTPAYDHEDVIDLRFLVGLLKAHKWFMLIITALCVILGGGYSATQPAIYQSFALIKVNGDSNSSASNLMAVLGMSTGAASGGFMNASPAEVETSLIQSDYVIGDAVRQLRLNISVTPKTFPVLGPLWTTLFPTSDDDLKIQLFNVPKTLEAVPFELHIENKVGDYVLYGPKHQTILRGKIGQIAVSQDDSIHMTIASWSPNSGHQFIIKKQPTDKVVEQLLKNLTIKEQGDKTGILAVSYKSKDPEFSQKMLEAILQVAVEKNIAEKAAEATKTLTFLQQQLPQITQDLDASEKRLNVYRSETGTSDDTIEAQLLLQEMVSLEKDLNELNLKKVELLENFTTKHPYIIAMDQKQAKIQQQLNDVKAQLRKLPLAAQEGNDLLRDIKVHGEIYSGVMQNVQQMEMLKGGTISSVRVLESASFPALAVPSKTSLIILISLVLGLSLSTAILLLQYSLARNLDPLLLEKVLGVQVLAVIPHSVAQAKLHKEMRSKKEQRQHYLLSLEQPKDSSIEALRGLRTALKLASLSDEDKKIIAISGCSPNVGKSFVSSNLIPLLADFGGKVLLIDADMRKGYMHKIFSCAQSPGLSEYLQGSLSVAKTIRRVLPNVDLITTGDYPMHPAELLMHKRFGELIHQISKDYDFVLIDTPPVLAVTDASLVFKFADIKLLLVGMSQDQLKEIEHTKGILTKAGFTLDGIICNNLNQGDKKYGYRGGYNGYNYHYQYE
jgi:tyrosine-protein kinase Etk/Wzc